MPLDPSGDLHELRCTFGIRHCRPQRQGAARAGDRCVSQLRRPLGALCQHRTVCGIEYVEGFGSLLCFAVYGAVCAHVMPRVNHTVERFSSLPRARNDGARRAQNLRDDLSNVGAAGTVIYEAGAQGECACDGGV